MKPNAKEDPTRDLKQLLQELRSVINEEPAVPLGKSEEDGRETGNLEEPEGGWIPKS